MRKKLLALFFLLILSVPTFLFPTPAHAIGNVVTISTNSSHDAIYPQTVTDSKGYLHMVWMEMDGTVPNPGIFYSRWNGDIWSTPLKISENTGFAEIPSIAVDQSDGVHVVWTDDSAAYSPDGFRKIAYKTRTASGVWSAIEAVPSPAGTTANSLPNVAIDSTNTPHVVFSGNTDGNKDSVYWVTRSNEVWSTTVQRLSQDTSGNMLTDVQWSDLVYDASGNIHLIYWSGQGIFYRKYTGGWSNPVLVTGNANLEFPRMSVTPGGDVFITWAAVNDSSVRVRWTENGVWQTETTLTTTISRPFYSSGIVGVTTDSKGRAHVGWGERNANNKIDLKYRSYVSGTWQPVQDVDLDNEDAMMPFVFPDKWDNQHFSWSEKDPITGKWKINYRVAEGTVQNVTTAGGIVTSNPSNVTEAVLSVPANALTESTAITIQVGPVPENVDSTVVTLPKAYTFRPHGLVFANGQTATATIHYLEADIAGADERMLKPWFWNSETNSWEAQTGTNDTTANTIAVSLAHFSLYGISAPKVVTTWIRPDIGTEVTRDSIHFKANVVYANGDALLEPQSPSEMIIKVKDAQGTTKSTLLYEKNVIKETGKSNYQGKINISDTAAYPNGTYTLELYVAGSLMSIHEVVISR